MLIRPRPIPPYWPAYPEPERSRLEAEYRKLESEWQRESSRTLLLETIMACLGPATIAAAAWAIWFVFA